jgi:hypothetical protein
MKLFHVLLSVYILALSSFACTDVDVRAEKTTSQISARQPSNPHEDETCSPFCICSCCGSMAVHFLEKTPLKPREIIFNTCFPSPKSNTIDISFSVWQPPKITC